MGRDRLMSTTLLHVSRTGMPGFPSSSASPLPSPTLALLFPRYCPQNTPAKPLRSRSPGELSRNRYISGTPLLLEQPPHPSQPGTLLTQKAADQRTPSSEEKMKWYQDQRQSMKKKEVSPFISAFLFTEVVQNVTFGDR